MVTFPVDIRGVWEAGWSSVGEGIRILGQGKGPLGFGPWVSVLGLGLP